MIHCHLTGFPCLDRAALPIHEPHERVSKNLVVYLMGSHSQSSSWIWDHRHVTIVHRILLVKQWRIRFFVLLFVTHPIPIGLGLGSSRPRATSDFSIVFHHHQAITMHDTNIIALLGRLCISLSRNIHTAQLTHCFATNDDADDATICLFGSISSRIPSRTEQRVFTSAICFLQQSLQQLYGDKFCVWFTVFPSFILSSTIPKILFEYDV